MCPPIMSCALTMNPWLPARKRAPGNCQLGAIAVPVRHQLQVLAVRPPGGSRIVGLLRRLREAEDAARPPRRLAEHLLVSPRRLGWPIERQQQVTKQLAGREHGP